jgi:hypothetical protein
MVDGLALRQIFSVENAAWTGILLLGLLVLRMWNGAPAMFEQWISYKRAKAEEKASDWRRLQEEIDRLSKSEQRCRVDFDKLHDDFLTLSKELAELRGWMAGQGTARQEAAGVVALDRLQERKKPGD